MWAHFRMPMDVIRSGWAMSLSPCVAGGVYDGVIVLEDDI
jgi:hypothetical protein